jgi:tetratricopeptide (TPR) repeat protein
MKKKAVYITTVLLFVVAILFVVIKYKKEVLREEYATYELLPRQGVLAQQEEWNVVKTNAATLLDKIKANPADKKSLLALSGIFIQEARVTGNHLYYDKAAMKYINKVLKADTNHFEALTLKALIQLSQHHFTEGLATAQRARIINPYNAFVYGILVDAHVEMGNYDSAIVNASHMIDIRPDIRSYARISYLREIHGDYAGAIAAMKLAIQAGIAGDETTAWSRVQLGHLYENVGDIEGAAIQYKRTLEERPSYAYALAGLARIATVKENYDTAITCYLQADKITRDFSFKEALTEVYELAGQKNKASEIAVALIETMSCNAEAAVGDENIGHYSDRELAYAYLNVNNEKKALEHALLEYNRRPNNIDANETLAWAYYCNGDYEKALIFIKKALRTNSKNPTLLCRAGLIYAKCGNKTAAKDALQYVLNTNANIAKALKTESIGIIQSL